MHLRFPQLFHKEHEPIVCFPRPSAFQVFKLVLNDSEIVPDFYVQQTGYRMK